VTTVEFNIIIIVHNKITFLISIGYPFSKKSIPLLWPTRILRIIHFIRPIRRPRILISTHSYSLRRLIKITGNRLKSPLITGRRFFASSCRTIYRTNYNAMECYCRVKFFRMIIYFSAYHWTDIADISIGIKKPCPTRTFFPWLANDSPVTENCPNQITVMDGTTPVSFPTLIS